MLFMLVSIAENTGGIIPENTGKLMKSFFGFIFKRELQRNPTFNIEISGIFLSQIAFTTRKNGLIGFKKSHALQILTKVNNDLKLDENILAILISIPLITNANDILGGIGAAIVIVALALVYAKTSFYQPKELDKLSPFIPEIPNTIKQNGAPVSYINNPKNVVYI